LRGDTLGSPSDETLGGKRDRGIELLEGGQQVRWLYGPATQTARRTPHAIVAMRAPGMKASENIATCDDGRRLHPGLAAERDFNGLEFARLEEGAIQRPDVSGGVLVAVDKAEADAGCASRAAIQGRESKRPVAR
jgi:hypothetical protein